jgi:hypothetical protein
MKRVQFCLVVNVVLVGVVWCGLCVGGAVLMGSRFQWWHGAVLAVVALPVAGYFVQHVVSGLTNRIIMGHRSGGMGEWRA